MRIPESPSAPGPAQMASQREHSDLAGRKLDDKEFRLYKELKSKAPVTKVKHHGPDDVLRYLIVKNESDVTKIQADIDAWATGALEIEEWGQQGRKSTAKVEKESAPGQFTSRGGPSTRGRGGAVGGRGGSSARGGRGGSTAVDRSSPRRTEKGKEATEEAAPEASPSASAEEAGTARGVDRRGPKVVKAAAPAPAPAPKPLTMADKLKALQETKAKEAEEQRLAKQRAAEEQKLRAEAQQAAEAQRKAEEEARTAQAEQEAAAMAEQINARAKGRKGGRNAAEQPEASPTGSADSGSKGPKAVGAWANVAKLPPKPRAQQKPKAEAAQQELVLPSEIPAESAPASAPVASEVSPGAVGGQDLPLLSGQAGSLDLFGGIPSSSSFLGLGSGTGPAVPQAPVQSDDLERQMLGESASAAAPAAAVVSPPAPESAPVAASVETAAAASAPESSPKAEDSGSAQPRKERGERPERGPRSEKKPREPRAEGGDGGRREGGRGGRAADKADRAAPAAETAVAASAATAAAPAPTSAAPAPVAAPAAADSAAAMQQILQQMMMANPMALYGANPLLASMYGMGFNPLLAQLSAGMGVGAANPLLNPQMMQMMQMMSGGMGGMGQGAAGLGGMGGLSMPMAGLDATTFGAAAGGNSSATGSAGQTGFDASSALAGFGGYPFGAMGGFGQQTGQQVPQQQAQQQLQLATAQPAQVQQQAQPFGGFQQQPGQQQQGAFNAASAQTDLTQFRGQQVPQQQMGGQFNPQQLQNMGQFGQQGQQAGFANYGQQQQGQQLQQQQQGGMQGQGQQGMGNFAFPQQQQQQQNLQLQQAINQFSSQNFPGQQQQQGGQQQQQGGGFNAGFGGQGGLPGFDPSAYGQMGASTGNTDPMSNALAAQWAATMTGMGMNPGFQAPGVSAFQAPGTQKGAVPGGMAGFGQGMPDASQAMTQMGFPGQAFNQTQPAWGQNQYGQR